MKRFLLAIGAATIFACSGSPSRQEAGAPEKGPRGDGIAAFAIVQRVLQHPRCQNCHVPGDAPLQFDDGREHGQFVQRGKEGMGADGFSCETCHGPANPPASYGPHTPPGAPGWRLPPPEHRMVFIHLTGAQLCRNLQDREKNGGRDLEKLLDHVSHDPLVLWGWDPGAGRTPVDVPHEEFVAAFKRWIDAGAPCPKD
jgi:hypothetical protein